MILVKFFYRALIVISIFNFSGWKNLDKYEWLPTESAHKQYPVSIIKGEAVLADGTSISFFKRTMVNSGWGDSDSSYVIGEVLKPLPVKIMINWFSYVEDKFFEGHFDLPAAQLEQAFKQGLVDPDTGERTNYNYIITGMAPRGNVSVWIAGSGMVKEVARFQAKEVQLDWSYVSNNSTMQRKDYIQMMLKDTLDEKTYNNIQQYGLNSTRWNRYPEQFDWKLELTGIKVSTMWLTLKNGEREYFSATKVKLEHKKRAAPGEIRLEWISAGQGYSAEIKFNEDEIYSGFDQLFKGNLEESIKLLIEINPVLFKINLNLQDAEVNLKLEKAEVKIYKQ